MVLEIVGNTVNAEGGGGDYAVELFNLWTQTDAETDGVSFTSTGGASGGGVSANKGLIYAQTTQGGHFSSGTRVFITPDLLPLLSRTNISFQGSCFVASSGINASSTDGYSKGHNGTAYIRLTDGTNTLNLLYAKAWATSVFSSDNDAAASGAFASGMINLTLNGNTITITVGGKNYDFGYTYNGSNSVSPSITHSSTIVTDGSTLDISSWSSLKVEGIVYEGSLYNGGYPCITYTTISPIMVVNSKLGSNKTE